MRSTLMLAAMAFLPSLAAAESPAVKGQTTHPVLSLFVHEGTLRANSDWDDAFTPLPGFDLEATLLERNLVNDVGLGFFLAAGLDAFSGQSETFNLNSVEVDDMTMWNVQIGCRVLFDFGSGFFGTASLGLGVAHYPEIHETVTLGGVSERVELVERCYRMTGDVGVRVGYQISSVALLAGVKYRVVDHPEPGDDTLPGDSPFDNMASVLFEVGVQVEF
jgi:hypothetical protein